ncbi:NAD(P)-dependent dehydrogenase (short-subunit alcohol dehydrogenase family) [Dyadobacter sp. BE34]|uniref:NAD(P)-dependent dehydrogenase (Short-subunit alcohol dehydrogenase family) n=1 Tax=Dyadobacter fermentans TaxID=94254 RepID=A0ABU1QYD7_9BACT|nr:MULTISPECIES: oxidoreductase [Dyadobacter]MDR6805745.1 NAD(P)-dependent dehydrogenase (short-subunit alcohol dehydrogenase family) [Dyadobacter fermentans]MDR7042495.1 NAD(P)-dependent dehydrogenase (short-subunit alcohol dehydrogenase family) [Dyadobacter sp. BE242]MDR7196807.1 NAD(P)-dependent dehydrogenase (short-subunit alcohol dehydrogenase family) [Dyadobacter sp. BE34]MDR7215758.1 NAD(P)-dependent dehydrogenase (short-subunit alcohol dehydrogenase family) [Dyadobacter sp. BE31]MDR726
MENRKVWFVTGASKGLGLALVQKLLANGFAVAATSRSIDELKTAVGSTEAQFLPLSVSLTDEQSVGKAIADTLAAFGRIDVVVNNAGYGLAGSLEELSDAESRGNFDVNVFGTLNVIRAVMPHLRAQESGHILNISSIAGITGAFPGFGIYCATKFAVNGLSESLAAEVADFGVKVTIVEPGYFRTDFLTAGSFVTPKNSIADYQKVRDSEALHQQQINGQQPGDPAKAADAMIRIAGKANPPLHLVLGEDAFGMANAKITAFSNELENWKSVSVSTNFDA